MSGTKADASHKREAPTRAKRGEADPKQYERFLEAAREHGCEENPDRIDEAVRRAAKMPPPRQESPKPGKGKKVGG